MLFCLFFFFWIIITNRKDAIWSEFEVNYKFIHLTYKWGNKIAITLLMLEILKNKFKTPGSLYFCGNKPYNKGIIFFI